MNRKHSIKLSARSRCIMLVNRNVDKFSSGPGFLADDPPPLVLPKKNKKYAQRSAQFHKVRQPVQFTVFRNGLSSDKGTRFLLKAREMKSFETVLSIISFKIRLVEGAVRRLFTLEGGILHGPEDIVDGGQYVACGHRRFIPAPYGEIGQPPKTHKLPSIKRRKDLNQPSPRTQSNPLPAIQKKATEKKARSEKDSPAPIEEDKGNDDVMVIVSRGSQADLVEDDPVPAASEDGAGELLDQPASASSASDALEIDSPEGVKTPPPGGHVNYDNDLHDTNNALYETVEGSGADPGQLTDGDAPDSETELDPENGEPPPRRLTPIEQTSPVNSTAGHTDLADKPPQTSDVVNGIGPSDDPETEMVPKSATPAAPGSSNEAVLQDEIVPDKEDDPVDAPEDISRTDAISTENVEEDISKTEITTVPAKSKLPVLKKSNQAISSDAESEAGLEPGSGEPPPRRLTPFEQPSPDYETEVSKELLDEAPRTPNVDYETEVVPKSYTPAVSDSSDDEYLEDPGYEMDLIPEDEEPSPRTPFEQKSPDYGVRRFRYAEEFDEPSETPDVNYGTARSVGPEDEVAAKSYTPAVRGPKDEEFLEDAEYEMNLEPENEEPPPLSPEQKSPDTVTAEYAEEFDEPSETPDVNYETVRSVEPEVDQVVQQSATPPVPDPRDEEFPEDAGYEMTLDSENEEPPPRTPYKFKRKSPDNETAEYAEEFDEPSETPDVVSSRSVEPVTEVVAKCFTPAVRGPKDEEFLEDAEYEMNLDPENEVPPSLSPEQKSPDDPTERYAEEFDEPSETPDVNYETARSVEPEVDQVVPQSATPPCHTDPRDEEFLEDAEYEMNVDPENEGPLPRTPYEQKSPDSGTVGHAEEYDEPSETPDVDYETTRSVEPEIKVVPKSATPPVPDPITSDEEFLEDAEYEVDLDPDDEEPLPLSPFEQKSPDSVTAEYAEEFEEPSETPDVDYETARSVEPEIKVVPKSASPAVPDPISSDEEFLEEEIKSVPSKSKLDRNPPKKKGNPELLANGKDDSVFNATVAKAANQDGQFLMNNVDEGATNGHEDVEEIEEDGELVEDKPIDLQQAEEIPDDDLNVPKADRRRSLSSNK